LSGIDGKSYTLADQISFSYPVAGVTYSWQFTPSNSPPAILGFEQSMAGMKSSVAGSATATTRVPQAQLSQFDIGTGRYELTVTVSLGNQSQTASAALAVVASDLVNIRVYPNPWKAGKHTGPMIFDNLPSGSTIKLFTASGHLIKTLNEAS